MTKHHHTAHAAHHAASSGPDPNVLKNLAITMMTGLGVLIGTGALAAGIAYGLRATNRRWEWALLAAPLAAIAWLADPLAGEAVAVAGALAAAIGLHRHIADRRSGADRAARARNQRGLDGALRHALTRLRRTLVTDISGLAVGSDSQSRPVRIPVTTKPTHTLVVGATGSGKTVTQAWILARAIEFGYTVIAIDPKGDDLLRAELAQAAARTLRPFREWSPSGELTYNPFAHGSDSEIADKAIAGERWTEPHYQRQAQRYIAHAVRTIRANEETVTLAGLLAAMDPDHLARIGRKTTQSRVVGLAPYIDSLTPEQRRGLAGVRDRLAILTESEVGPLLACDPRGLDLLDELERRTVVLFRLEADRWPLLAEMLAAAIVTDLITLTAHHQGAPVRAVIAIDEFSAITPEHITRLFGRARSAGFSLLLGTQELADLQHPDHPTLLPQVLANTATVIAHRQRVPESAELIAQIAGTRGAWTTTRRTDGLGAPTRAGTRTRTREFHTHPDELKTLPVGTAMVITDDGQPPRRSRMHHPREHDNGRLR